MRHFLSIVYVQYICDVLYVMCMYVCMYLYTYELLFCCTSDGGLAEVYPGADIQGEEGSEEDAARAQYAG